MIKDKIKSLFKMRSKSNQDGADALGMPYHSFTNKLNQRGFKTDELIKIAELTDTQLAFIDKDGKALITFDKEDIEKDPHSN